MNIERASAEEKTVVEKPEAKREQKENFESKINEAKEISKKILNDSESTIDNGNKRAQESTVNLGGSQEDVTNVLSALKPVQAEIQETAAEASEKVYRERLSMDVYRLPDDLQTIESYAEGRNMDVDVSLQLATEKLRSTMSDRSDGKNLKITKEMSPKEIDEIQAEKRAIRESLAYLAKGGGDVDQALGSLTAKLYTERNILEQEIDPSGLQDTADLKKEMQYLKSLLGEEGEISTIPGEALSSETGYAKEVFKSAVLIEKGDLIGEISIYNKDGEKENVEMGEILHRIENGESISLELTAEEKRNVQAEIDNLQDLVDKKPAEGKQKSMLENRVENLTEILKVVSETQKQARKLEKEWEKNVDSIKESFEFTDYQQEAFQKRIDKEKGYFFREHLISSSENETTEINSAKIVEYIERQARLTAGA